MLGEGGEQVGKFKPAAVNHRKYLFLHPFAAKRLRACLRVEWQCVETGEQFGVDCAAAGNQSIAVKLQTTLTAILVRRLAIEAGLPEAAWQLVPGNGAEVGDALVPLVDGLSFTGSTKVGKSIAAQAAGRLIPTMLELGGKNPMLVLDDAPLEPTARGAVRTAFSSSGQLCMSAERAYVHTDIYEDFLVALEKMPLADLLAAYKTCTLQGGQMGRDG